jgi:hypothetical protein
MVCERSAYSYDTATTSYDCVQIWSLGERRSNSCDAAVASCHSVLMPMYGSLMHLLAARPLSPPRSPTCSWRTP